MNYYTNPVTRTRLYAHRIQVNGTYLLQLLYPQFSAQSRPRSGREYAIKIDRSFLFSFFFFFKFLLNFIFKVFAPVHRFGNFLERRQKVCNRLHLQIGFLQGELSADE